MSKITKRSKSSRDIKPRPAPGPVALLIGTRKGAFILRGDKKRQNWKLSDPIFLGHIAHHFVSDPRDNRTMLLAARTGHLGPTVFRSTDFGKTWKEAKNLLPFLKPLKGKTDLLSIMSSGSLQDIPARGMSGM